MNDDTEAMSAFLEVVETNHFLTKNLLSVGEGSLADRLDSLALENPPRFHSRDLVDSLVAELFGIEQPKQVAIVLRRFYASQLIRIAHGEFVRDLPPDRVGRQISAVADAVVEAALRYVIDRLADRRGMPERSDGSTPEVTVIGLGNLGGQEIGYTSPLKLLFLYDAIDEKTYGIATSTKLPSRKLRNCCKALNHVLTVSISIFVRDPGTKSAYRFAVSVRRCGSTRRAGESGSD